MLEYFFPQTPIYFPEVQIIGLPVLPVKSLRKIRTNNLQYQLINRNSHMKFCYNKNKEFYNINITLWLETVDESTIIPIIIEHFIFKKRGFEIVGDIRVEGSFPIESARVKNALYCIYIVHKTLDWE